LILHMALFGATYLKLQVPHGYIISISWVSNWKMYFTNIL
jgi:hypothetical protein